MNRFGIERNPNGIYDVILQLVDRMRIVDTAKRTRTDRYYAVVYPVQEVIALGLYAARE